MDDAGMTPTTRQEPRWVMCRQPNYSDRTRTTENLSPKTPSKPKRTNSEEWRSLRIAQPDRCMFAGALGDVKLSGDHYVISLGPRVDRPSVPALHDEIGA